MSILRNVDANQSFVVNSFFPIFLQVAKSRVGDISGKNLAKISFSAKFLKSAPDELSFFALWINALFLRNSKSCSAITVRSANVDRSAIIDSCGNIGRKVNIDKRANIYISANKDRSGNTGSNGNIGRSAGEQCRRAVAICMSANVDSSGITVLKIIFLRLRWSADIIIFSNDAGKSSTLVA